MWSARPTLNFFMAALVAMSLLTGASNKAHSANLVTVLDICLNADTNLSEKSTALRDIGMIAQSKQSVDMRIASVEHTSAIGSSSGKGVVRIKSHKTTYLGSAAQYRAYGPYVSKFPNGPALFFSDSTGNVDLLVHEAPNRIALNCELAIRAPERPTKLSLGIKRQRSTPFGVVKFYDVPNRTNTHVITTLPSGIFGEWLPDRPSTVSYTLIQIQLPKPNS